MATIVNTPGQTTDSGNGVGFLLGIILLIAFFMLFFFYGLPYIGQLFQGYSSGPQVNVPGKIDVNVHSPQGK